MIIEDIDEIIKEFNIFFRDTPERFLSEGEIRNELYRRLLAGLIHNDKYPGFNILREYLANKKPRVKYDIVVEDDSKNIVAAFELKYVYSNVLALMKQLGKDITRLETYSKDSCKGYVLFYNNFENYPSSVLSDIRGLKHGKKITIISVSLPQDTLKEIQDKYMQDYTPSYPVKG